MKMEADTKPAQRLPPTQQEMQRKYDKLSTILGRLCERLENNTLVQVLEVFPDDNSGHRFVDDYDRAPRDAAIALSFFCIFETVMSPVDLVENVSSRLADNMRLLAKNALRAVAHSGDLELSYNLMYGQYLRCVLNDEFPTIEDFVAIYAYLTPNDTNLAAFEDWKISSTTLQARKGHPQISWILMSVLYQYVQKMLVEPPQYHPLAQIMFVLERWGADMNVEDRLAAARNQAQGLLASAQAGGAGWGLGQGHSGLPLQLQSEPRPRPQSQMSGSSMLGNTQNPFTTSNTHQQVVHGLPSFGPQPGSPMRPVRQARQGNIKRERSSSTGDADKADIVDDDPNDADQNGGA